MRRARILVAVLLLGTLGASLCDARSLTESEMRRIWLSNGAVQGVQEFQFGAVDWEANVASVTGHSPVGQGPQGKLLAKRQAVTDAQRNLLYLLYELRYGLPERLSRIDVEGQVVMGHIDRETEEGGDYVIEVTLPLKRLFEECVIWKAKVE